MGEYRDWMQDELDETNEKLAKAIDFIRSFTKWPCYDCYADDEAETFLKENGYG